MLEVPATFSNKPIYNSKIPLYLSPVFPSFINHFGIWKPEPTPTSLHSLPRYGQASHLAQGPVSTCTWDLGRMGTKFLGAWDICRFPETGVPPNHPFYNRIFHYKPSILGYPQKPSYAWKEIIGVKPGRICYSICAVPENWDARQQTYKKICEANGFRKWSTQSDWPVGTPWPGCLDRFSFQAHLRTSRNRAKTLHGSKTGFLSTHWAKISVTEIMENGLKMAGMHVLQCREDTWWRFPKIGVPQIILISRGFSLK